MTELSESDWVLLADMGGTHARFAYLKPDAPVPQLIGVYTADTCPTFDDVMDQSGTLVFGWSGQEIRQSLLQDLP
ncbi:MAG: hypothetical protein ACPGLW_06495, partial [Luminiphilus sp.]